MDNKLQPELEFMEYISSGNHELFHSNVLAYLAKNQPEFFRNIFDLPDSFKYDLNRVEREYENFDLCLFNENTGEVIFVLENKMKSLPYKKQLDNYEKKVKKLNKDKGSSECKFILLSLIESSFSLENWTNVSYKDLVYRMTSNMGMISSDKVCYLKPFIEDYIRYVGNVYYQIIEASEFVNRPGLTVKQLDEEGLADKLKWESTLILKARYLALAKELAKRCEGLDVMIENPFYQGKPIIEALIGLEPASKTVLESVEDNDNETKNKDDKDIDLYFIHLHNFNINRGFRIHNSESKNHTGRVKKEPDGKLNHRQQFLSNIWAKKINVSDVGKKLKESLKKISNIDLTEYLNSSSKFKAYVFDNFAMPYLKYKISTDLEVRTLLDDMEKEIKAVAENM